LQTFRVELRVAFGFLDHLVVAAYGRVAFEHIQDEVFLDCLLHGVAVERPVLNLALGVRGQRLSEHSQRFVLRRGSEGEGCSAPRR
jgi:hypothetical protein